MLIHARQLIEIGVHQLVDLLPDLRGHDELMGASQDNGLATFLVEAHVGELPGQVPEVLWVADSSCIHI